MSVPEISVVMTTHNVASSVKSCLESLRRQSLREAAEIIVADSSTDGTDEMIRDQFPEVRLLHTERPAGLPELMRDALKSARGRIVAVTDPWCTFPEDWLEKVRRAHNSEFAVIGGAVENGCTDRIIDWACYFADYGAFMLPAEKKETPVLPGNHVSYKREAVVAALDAMQDGFRKTLFHWDLARRGVRFLFNPELVARWARRNSFGDFARRYFHNGRAFAAVRSKRISSLERAARALTAPALPVLLLIQRLRAVLGKRRHLARVLATVPLVAVFVIAWSAGEFLGYLAGPEKAPRGVRL
jgi:glycosyltransferase involved in cell wall biosynthesis